MKIKGNTFFFSDPHYHHKNICKGVSSWGGKDQTRPFDTLDEMNDKIVNDINETVGQDDWLVCLGDWSFGGFDKIEQFRSRLVCQKIILVYGNHDEHIIANRGGVQDLFHSTHFRLQLNANGEVYELNHFPMAVWDQAHHGRCHLFGHVHGSFDNGGRSLDVGIDNIFKIRGNYKPLSQDDIHTLLKDKEYVQKSHHDESTN